MKFKILYDSKKRMRIHSLFKSMSLKEADILEKYVLEIDGVVEAKVNERTLNTLIYYTCDRAILIEKLRAFKYSENKESVSETGHSAREINRKYKEKLIGLVMTRVLFNALLPVNIRNIYTVIRSIPFILRGLRSLAKFKLDVNVLDGLAVGVSILRSDFKTAGSVTFLLNIGDELEEWTHKKSVDDLARSMSLGVDRVWIRTENGEEVQVALSSVKETDLIVMRVGNVIPVDGVVESGEVMVNQASMTGESLPVRKSCGTTVYAGTVIEEGDCLIRPKEAIGESRYDKVGKLIEESEKLKSDIENRASGLADKLVPYTIFGSALVYLLTGNVTKALSVLMVDYSCALKLSMPLSVLSAMSEAGKHHITVKGGKYMESVATADTIVFDKTGTLTNAAPKVVGVTAFLGNDKNEMLRVAACLEEHFPHSVATAVVNAAKELGLEHEEMHSSIEYIVAHGISSIIDEKKVIIGSYHFVFEDEGCIVNESEKDKFENIDSAYSHLYLAIDGQLAAIIDIFDPIRDEAIEVIKTLRSLGVGRVAMLTGDSHNTAAAIADKIGVDYFKAGVLPEDKASFIKEEKARGHRVIMVGDGINDAPALSEADVGIAVNDGASIARQIADITISAQSLYELVLLKCLSDELMKRIHSNYKMVIGFNSLLIGFGLLGFMQPTTSALLHNLSTVLISLNSTTPLIDDN